MELRADRPFSAKPKRFSPSPRREEGWCREEKSAGRRINGVCELLLSRESIPVDLHVLVMTFWFYENSMVLNKKSLWVGVYVKTMPFETSFFLKMVNWPIKNSLQKDKPGIVFGVEQAVKKYGLSVEFKPR